MSESKDAIRIIQADVRVGLSQLADETISCVVTSPPYWSLRKYNLPPQKWSDGYIGIELSETYNAIAKKRFEKKKLGLLE